jgi:hypothetical protein
MGKMVCTEQSDTFLQKYLGPTAIIEVRKSQTGVPHTERPNCHPIPAMIFTPNGMTQKFDYSPILSPIPNLDSPVFGSTRRRKNGSPMRELVNRREAAPL